MAKYLRLTITKRFHNNRNTTAKANSNELEKIRLYVYIQSEFHGQLKGSSFSEVWFLFKSELRKKIIS